MVREWSWLKGGVALGLLSAFAFVTYKPLGVSTSYPRTVALLLNPIAPEFVAENAYFQKVPPIVDWQLMLVIGIVIGGFIASRVVARLEEAAAKRDGGARGGGGTPTGGDGVTLGSTAASSGDAAVAASGEGDACAIGRENERPADPRRKWRAFFGGFLVLFGARLADGCTSGHVITGMTQLATASFLFAAAVFAVGIPAAKWFRAKGWA